MRLLLLSLVLFSQVSKAQAGCGVYIPEKEFNYYGWIINFDFTEMLKNKNYHEVATVEESDYQLTLQGIEQEGTFHHAVGELTFGTQKVSESVVCYTQMCALGDYAKAFSKSYKKLAKQIPACN